MTCDCILFDFAPPFGSLSVDLHVHVDLAVPKVSFQHPAAGNFCEGALPQVAFYNLQKSSVMCNVSLQLSICLSICLSNPCLSVSVCCLSV